jgi:hypothetical protein
VVLLHRRELLIRSRFLWTPAARLAAAAACVLALAACGEEGAPPAEESTVAIEPFEAADPAVPDGSPMPSADVSGVAPYPGAVVWNLAPRRPDAFHFVEAFTADSFPDVVAFYDEHMGPPWRREQFEDAVTWTLEPDMGAVFLTPWDGRQLPDSAPAALRAARSGIGVSWRKEAAAPADTAATAGT